MTQTRKLSVQKHFVEVHENAPVVLKNVSAVGFGRAPSFSEPCLLRLPTTRQKSDRKSYLCWLKEKLLEKVTLDLQNNEKTVHIE